MTKFRFAFVFAILWSQIAFSGTPGDGSGFYIQPTEPGVDVRNVTNKPATILDPPQQELYQSTLPTLEARDKVFAQSGLTEAVSQLDNFDRDSVYLRLRSTDPKTIELIVAKFSQLRGHEADLEKARHLIASEGARHE